MNPNFTTFLALSLLTATASAQLSTTILSTTRTPRSIVLAPNPIGNHVVVSMSQQSEQIPVNVTIPTVPVVGASAFHGQDQFCDAWWVQDFGGRLLSAHRFGGVQMWDASPGTLSGPVTTLGYTATNYSHEGLKTYSPPGATFVLYSEQHTSSSGFGGLIVYQLGASALTQVGQLLFPAGAGRDLDVSRDGRFVWQWGDRNNNLLDGVLRVYDTNGYGGNPTLLNTVPYAYTYGYADTDLVRNTSQTTLVSAMGWDGLIAIDVTTPATPVINTMVGAQQTLFFDGVTMVPNTDVALTWGFVKIGTLEVDFMQFLNTGTPGLAIPIGGAIFPGFRVDDVKVQVPNVHCVGRTRTTNLQSVLVIY